MKAFLKKTIPSALIAVALMFGGAVAPVYDGVVSAANKTSTSISTGADAAKPTGASSTLFGKGSIFQTIVDAMLYIIGAVSVVMLIYGGIRYTISGGDQSSVTAAKNTILYAIIGIVVAFLAYAVVHWVLVSLAGA